MKRCNKLLAALCLALIACLAVPAILPAGLEAAVSARASSKIQLNKTKATVYNGKTLQLKVAGTKSAVKWSSSDASVAKVSARGLVTARKVGAATITAKVGSKKLKCRVTVKSPLSAAVSAVTLNPGESRTVKLTWKLSGKLSLKTYNSGIIQCKINRDGDNKCSLTIKAIRPGSQTLTIRNSKTADVAKIKVKVREVKTDTPIVDKTSVTVAKGKSATVKVYWPYDTAKALPQTEYNPDLVETSWGTGFNGGWPLTIKGVGKGTGVVNIYKSKDGKTFGDPVATITVKVK